MVTAVAARPAGLRIEEELTGWWSPDAAADADDLSQYDEAARDGEEAGRTLVLSLTLTADDIDRLTDDLATPVAVSGTVTARRLGGVEPVPVVGGSLRLVVPDPAEPGVSHMRYELPLPSAGLHLSGSKRLTAGDVTQLWGASTTLHVSIRLGGSDGATLGRGVVRLSPAGFVRQLRSLDVPDHHGDLDELGRIARFGAVFFGALWDDYGTIVQRTAPLRRSAPPRRQRPLDAPLPTVHPYRTGDGVDLRLTRYRGGSRGPVVLVHGMGANPLTFSLDTISPNLLEHLVARGFDVWVQEWRGSTHLPASRSEFDCDVVARHDHPAAERVVRAETGRHDVHWVTHCVGSMTWLMATLAGTVTPASLLLSQVGAHPVAPRLSRLKAALRAPDLLRALGVRFLTTDTYDDSSWKARLLDQALRLHPIGRDEHCGSAVCRRLAFIYGGAVHHRHLDPDTHDALHELFGITNLRMMEHLALCAREERLVDAGGRDAYLPHVARARFPITLLHGEHNQVWLPESTARDHAWLTGALGSGQVERVVLGHTGHQDSFMGAEAPDRTFPAVVAHLGRAGA